jgi:Fe-S cluster biogenesis protein NfuA
MNPGPVSRVAVFVEPTPNPNSLKFVVGRRIVDRGSHEFATAEQAAASPLAAAIFKVPGVDGVFIGGDFVTVRKTTEATWDAIEPEATRLIEDEVSSGRPLVAAEAEGESAERGAGPEGVIRRILDEEIRPAVASDGGDVVFQDYKEGTLTLRLVGACSGCPSSILTLKMGIERRLREDVPELKEVVSVM